MHLQGFVHTLRGRARGLRQSRVATKISIGQVFRVFDSNAPFVERFAANEDTRPLTEACRLCGFISPALKALHHELDMDTLDDVVRGNCALSALLSRVETPRRLCIET